MLRADNEALRAQMAALPPAPQPPAPGLAPDTSATRAAPNDEPGVYRVSVKLPPFWEDQPTEDQRNGPPKVANAIIDYPFQGVSVYPTRAPLQSA